MNVKEIMATKLCVVEPETSLGAAATVMGEQRVGSVIVCEDDRLAGIVTERDIVRALSSDFDAPQRAVIEFMTKEPRTVSPETDVREALRTMVDGGFRHLPVTEGGKVVGMVSMRDLAGVLSEEA